MPNLHKAISILLKTGLVLLLAAHTGCKNVNSPNQNRSNPQIFFVFQTEGEPLSDMNIMIVIGGKTERELTLPRNVYRRHVVGVLPPITRDSEVEVIVNGVVQTIHIRSNTKGYLVASFWHDSKPFPSSTRNDAKPALHLRLDDELLLDF